MNFKRDAPPYIVAFVAIGAALIARVAELAGGTTGGLTTVSIAFAAITVALRVQADREAQR